MLRFNFSLQLFWKMKKRVFRHFLSNSVRLTKNKSLEYEIYADTPLNIFDFTIDTRWIGRDHGGIELELEILGYTMRVQLYDHRHWNYDEWKWSEGL